MAWIKRHRAIQHEPDQVQGEGHGEAALTLRDGHRAPVMIEVGGGDGRQSTGKGRNLEGLIYKECLPGFGKGVGEICERREFILPHPFFILSFSIFNYYYC
jgi:hypothetical protein